jgi:hypothetical protein
LFWGLFLYSRDRAISRRRSVDDLITWLSWRETPDRDEGVRREVIVHVTNIGSRPMHAPVLTFPDRRGGYATEILSHDGKLAMLPPGAQIERAIQGQPQNTTARYVMIRGFGRRIWFRKVDEDYYPNALGQSLLQLLVFLLERPDGVGARRRRSAYTRWLEWTARAGQSPSRSGG